MFEFYLNLFDQKKLSTNDYIHSFAQFINLNGIQMTNVDELKDDEEYYTFNIPYKRQSYEYSSTDKEFIEFSRKFVFMRVLSDKDPEGAQLKDRFQVRGINPHICSGIHHYPILSVWFEDDNRQACRRVWI